MAATLVLFRSTSLGLRMRASAFAAEIARLLGVRVGVLLTLGWALAGVAGSLWPASWSRRRVPSGPTTWT